MAWEAWVTLGIVLLMLYLLARHIAAADTVLVGAMTALTALSVMSNRFPTPRATAAAFGNEGLLTVGVLFVVAAGVTETGALAFFTDWLLGRSRSTASGLFRLMVPVATVSAVVNNTPVVAMFMPVVQSWCRRTRISPSKVFLPLSYAAVLGGTCTLIGTSTNLVVQGLLLDAQRTNPAVPAFSMFTLTGVGVPVALCGIAFVVLTSRWLLPDRGASGAAWANPREYMLEMLVQPSSAVANRTVADAGLRHLSGSFLMEIERNGERLIAVGPEQVIKAGDRLLFVGVVDSVVELQRIRGLVPATDQIFRLDAPRHHRCLVEAVVSDRSPLVGRTVRDGKFRTRYGAVVIAVHRHGERINMKVGDIVLRAGDTLLVETQPAFVAHYRHSSDFLLVSEVADSTPRRHHRANLALAILIAMIVAAALEPVTGINLLVAALLAGCAMVATGCLSGAQARRSIDWSTLVVIGAALVVGKTIETSGLAAIASTGLVHGFQASGRWAVLASVYLGTLIATELVTNNAAAALMFPVALASAEAAGANVMPFAVVVAVAASAGFAVPFGYQTHLMVYGAGGYRFGDFVRIGLPLDLIVMAVTLIITPLLFPL
jgi:di/tricarboxylate transporter